MDDRQRSGLEELMPGGITFECPMDRLTTYHVGGNAEALCHAGELSALCRLVAWLRKEDIPYVVMGKGSNILAGDKGIRGAVIILKDGLASVERAETDPLLLLAGAGLTMVDLLIYCRKNALSGLEFMAGIPGTLGGAVFMNAGACGRDMGGIVRDVLVVKDDGQADVIGCNDMGFAYRSSSVPGGTVIYGARLELQSGHRDNIAEMIAGNLRKKKESQPLDYPSAGSVFKNPPGEYAGRLIEQAGLKGKKIGGAMISPRHGNFIVNTGDAKASDILDLINLAKARVFEETGITMETEIKILGEF